jgi:hypothetical protein
MDLIGGVGGDDGDDDDDDDDGDDDTIILSWMEGGEGWGYL